MYAQKNISQDENKIKVLSGKQKLRQLAINILLLTELLKNVLSNKKPEKGLS